MYAWVQGLLVQSPGFCDLGPGFVCRVRGPWVQGPQSLRALTSACVGAEARVVAGGEIGGKEPSGLAGGRHGNRGAQGHRVRD